MSKSAEQKSGKQKGVLVFLHGSGDNGPNFQKWVYMASKGKFESTLANNGIAVVYPSAKCIPYTLAAGMKMSVWHDRTGLGPKFPEDTEGIRNSLRSLDKNILNPLATKELPVVVGGFSQGGHMAMHVALNDCSNSNYNSTGSCSKKDNNSSTSSSKLESGNPRKNIQSCIKGCFVMSSYLHDDSNIYKIFSNENILPEVKLPLLMTHGTRDRMISSKWGEKTAKKLKDVGLDVRFKLIDGITSIQLVE